MAVIANFLGQKLNLSGYKISALHSSASAFEALNIYLIDEAEASYELSGIDISQLDQTNGMAIIGSLSITDTAKKIDYTFDDIGLVNVQTFITHRLKKRLITFSYKTERLRTGNFCTIKNSDTDNVAGTFTNDVATKYLFRTEGTEEPILGCSTSFGRSVNSAVQIVSKRSKGNSFMDLAIALKPDRDAQFTSKNVVLKDITLVLKEENLDYLLVDESYGTLLDQILPSLEDITVNFSDPLVRKNLVKLNYNPYTPLTYQKATIGVDDPQNASSPYSIETATLIFRSDRGTQGESKKIV